MAKKKETYGKPCGLLCGDIVVCGSVAPDVIYMVEKTRPRIGEADLVEMVMVAILSNKSAFMTEKNLILDAGHVTKINSEIVVKHIRRLSNDMCILLSALEKQQLTEEKRRECLPKEDKKQQKSSVTK